jgi:hypothetical protein
LLGCSGPSYFINRGTRDNKGLLEDSAHFQDSGIMVGLVGARFDSEGQMDHVVCGMNLSDEEATSPCAQDPRLTQIFRDFFCPEHASSGTDPTQLSIVDERFIKDMYSGRIRVSIETALLEADDRAAEDQVKAHLYIAGLGLGVWQSDFTGQTKWYIDEVAASIERLDLRHVNVVELNGWDTFGAAETQNLVDVGKKNGITVIANRKFAPCRKLATDDLLVRVWAFDSNSLVGMRSLLSPDVSKTFAN